MREREENLISDNAHDELMNWSRWCWLGEWPHPLPPSHCGSAEKRYVAPWPDELLDRQEKRTPVHHAHAEKVNSLFYRLEQNERWVMIAEYSGYERFPRQRSKRAHKLGLSESSYEMLLIRIGQKVEEVFA